MDEKDLEVRGKKIRIKEIKGNEMFSLTDIANQFGKGRASIKIYSWFKNQNTLDYLETFDEEYNPNHKSRKVKKFIAEARRNENALTLADYEKATKSPFVHVHAGRGGGSWAVFQIAAEFMMWISARFKVWFIKDYEVMKRNELLEEKNLDKFFAQKNIDNLLEILHNEQDRFKKLSQDSKKLDS